MGGWESWFNWCLLLSAQGSHRQRQEQAAPGTQHAQAHTYITNCTYSGMSLAQLGCIYKCSSKQMLPRAFHGCAPPMMLLGFTCRHVQCAGWHFAGPGVSLASREDITSSELPVVSRMSPMQIISWAGCTSLAISPWNDSLKVTPLQVFRTHVL